MSTVDNLEHRENSGKEIKHTHYLFIRSEFHVGNILNFSSLFLMCVCAYVLIL